LLSACAPSQRHLTAINDRSARRATIRVTVTPADWMAGVVVVTTMAKKFPIHPAHPERNCWGCDKYCAADQMACGNGTSRTQHPVEFFGDDWLEWQAPATAVAPEVKETG